LNQGVLGDFIESERKNNNKDGQDFFMDLTTYPSSLVAKLMYENLKSLLERKGVEVNSENMLNQLDTWTEDEKWEVEKTAFLAAKAFLRFINNNNEIRYSGNPQIDISSNIKKIEFQNPKMIVKPGGSGLIEIRKI
jgi:predicted xylose isomerase-like sugar epimerase